MKLAGVTVAVLGGDQREAELVRALLAEGAGVRLAAYPERPDWQAATRCDTLEEALEGARAVIAPMTGVDEAGFIRVVPDGKTRLRITEVSLQLLPPGTPFLIGTARPFLKEWCSRAGLRLIEMAEVDEIAILNSIPTAEGVIYLAIGELPITLHGSRVVVVGFGRTGQTLARVLDALGASTAVVARDRAQRARAYEMGLDPYPLEALREVVKGGQLVINTVPALVITEEVLRAMPPGTLVIDIASAPGGTDFSAAERLGIPAILALGLPGKIAPRTAGQILARTVPELLRELVPVAGR
ncbi:MAG TPA: dipicolinate synthase subunit DpsA [Firmicutes bacterium]|nr:dipicolinate synthase subunit DpsA [Bacillota bacterium]